MAIRGGPAAKRVSIPAGSLAANATSTSSPVGGGSSSPGGGSSTSAPITPPTSTTAIASISQTSTVSVESTLSTHSTAAAAASSAALESGASSRSLVSASEASISSISQGSTSSLASTTSAPVSTVFVTDGYTVTSSVSVPTVVVGSPKSSVNVGAIAGGVVGGVAALLLIAGLLWFCLRRRRRDDFDGNFDPDRNIERPATLPPGGRNMLDLGGAATLPSDVDTSPRPFSIDGDGNTMMSGSGGYAHTASSGMESGHPLLAAGAGAGAGALAGREWEQHHQNNQQGYPRPSSDYDPYHPDPYHQPTANPDYQYGGEYYNAAPGTGAGGAYPTSDSASMRTRASTGAGLAGIGGAMLSSPVSGPRSGSGSGGATGTRLTKQQEAARAYAASHGRPDPISVPPQQPGAGAPLQNSQGLGETQGVGSESSLVEDRINAHAPLSVVNPDAAESDPDMGGGSAVRQHQDGGRYRLPAMEPENETEIPPSYDSIPADER